VDEAELCRLSVRVPCEGSVFVALRQTRLLDALAGGKALECYNAQPAMYSPYLVTIKIRWRARQPHHLRMRCAGSLS
jgi:hypothetical protein